MGSQDRLIDDLMRKPRDSFRDQLVANAVAGLYHDFKSTHATPKLLLIDDLTRYGYRDIARKAKRGEYDDKQDAEDSAVMDKMLKDDPKLAALWDKMKDMRNPEDVFALMQDMLSPEERELARAELGEGFFRTVRKPG